jgi:hypothetical protein
VLPDSKIAVLKCAAHGLQMEKPKGFNALVRDFLAVNNHSSGAMKNPCFTVQFLIGNSISPQSVISGLF